METGTRIKMGFLQKITRLFSSRNQKRGVVGVCDCEKCLTVKNKLIKAAKLHHVKCVKSCLKTGADVNAKKMGKTALDCLAKTKEGKHFVTCYFNWNFLYFHLDVGASRHECIHVLLKATADVKHHTSLLTVASLVGCEDCVHLQLKAGITVDSDGITLFAAPQGGHHRCLKLLLEAGANVNFQYAFNYTLDVGINSQDEYMGKHIDKSRRRC